MEELSEKQLQKIEKSIREAVVLTTNSLCSRIPVMKLERPVIKAIVSKNVGRLSRNFLRAIDCDN